MRRLALVGAAALVALAGCGGTSDDTATGASASASASSPAAQECPLKARTVPAPAGSTTDLATKPVIAANAAPPPTDVTVADIMVGNGAEAKTLDKVEVKYVGALYDTGAEFDSSWKTSADTTFPFSVCTQGTVQGFAIAPTGMKVGGRREVTIPATYGYGAEGSPPTIPANATLVFVIDLVKVTPPTG